MTCLYFKRDFIGFFVNPFLGNRGISRDSLKYSTRRLKFFDELEFIKEELHVWYV